MSENSPQSNLTKAHLARAVAEQFGRNLSRLMDDHRLTPADIAPALGVTPDAVKKYIYGTREPRLFMLLALAEILETTVDALLLPSDATKKRVLPLAKLSFVQEIEKNSKG